jgi:hypothetical protein
MLFVIMLIVHMLIVIMQFHNAASFLQRHYAEALCSFIMQLKYAECRYSKCHYTECRGASEDIFLPAL